LRFARSCAGITGQKLAVLMRGVRSNSKPPVKSPGVLFCPCDAPECPETGLFGVGRYVDTCDLKMALWLAPQDHPLIAI
jgi:hypothetical protein